MEFLLLDNMHVCILVEHAMLGDTITLYSLSNDHLCVAIDPKLNTIKRAQRLPDRNISKESVYSE